MSFFYAFFFTNLAVPFFLYIRTPLKRLATDHKYLDYLLVENVVSLLVLILFANMIAITPKSKWMKK